MPKILGSNERRVQNGIHRLTAFSPGVLAVFSDRTFDASKNWNSFLNALGLSEGRYATVKQVHGSRVVVARPASNPAGDLEADGIVSREPNLSLIIRTADCAPVFLLDPVTPSIGVCHVGWRGARAGILERALEKMKAEFGANPVSIQAAVGPVICPACYEVGEEFKSYFPDFVTPKGPRYYFNLIGEVKSQLVRCGVPETSCWESGFCTACSTDRFFSVRREGQDTGRLLSLLMLK